MNTPVYVSVELTDEEIPVVQGLLNDSCSLLFATGVVYEEDYHLCWPTNLTDRLRSALRSFHSYRYAPFTARKLVHKIDAESNANC